MSKLCYLFMSVGLLCISACSFQPTPQVGVTSDPTLHSMGTPTNFASPLPSTLTPTTIINTPTLQTPTTTPTVAALPIGLLPPRLSRDYYPNGTKRIDLLNRLPQAIKKTGHINKNEIWSGVILITGDITVDPTGVLTIKPGTLVFISARKDDQKTGFPGKLDEMNPKDPLIDGSQIVDIAIQGKLFIQGTKNEPVIFTSDALEPRNYDWSGFDFQKSSEVSITRAIIEYGYGVGVNSSNTLISQCILRNMLGAVTIGSNYPEDVNSALALKPTITQNYIYNTGRHAITIRSGSPIITHNVVFARLDLETTGFEHGAIGTDFPSCAIITHNYLEGGMPAPYNGDVFGHYYEFTSAYGAGMNGTCFTFEYNTIIGSPLGLILRPGKSPAQFNNILVTPASGKANQFRYWNKYQSDIACLLVKSFKPEPSDTWQQKFIEQLGGISNETTAYATNNYWGTTDRKVLDQCIDSDAGVQTTIEPIQANFIEKALPDWQTFPW